MDREPVNQRDAQKRATRRALSAAAIDRFGADGFDGTRVEDIAADAGVTARTFFLHFPSKEAAAFPDHDERVAALATTLAADSADDPLPLLREQIALGVRHTVDSRVRAKRYALINQIDALRHHDLVHDLDYEAVIVDHLTARWSKSHVRADQSADVQFRARVVATTALAVARAALTTWASDRSFDPVIAVEARLEHLA